MILGLKIRTEYSFRSAFGRIEKVLELAEPNTSIAIVDRGGTWGHVPFREAARKANVKPVFGVELAVVADTETRERKMRTNFMSFIARNNEGLAELYELVTLATRRFYYVPRLDYADLGTISRNIIILSGPVPPWDSLPLMPNLYAQLGPASLPDTQRVAKRLKLKTVAVGDNFYPATEDRAPYEIVVGRGAESNPWPMHIIDEDEWRLQWNDEPALKRSRKLLEECNAELPKGKMVKFKSKKSLRSMCTSAAKGRGVNLSDPVYKARLNRELKLIAEKGFEDYFYVIADMLAYAKRTMLVGPARGSSCGSLVCYLLAITEIDPIPYGLLFERFIDLNREDLPDIDIDFPDVHRDRVFGYLADKYGADCVARLGTVSRYHAKSTIGDVAKGLDIPQYEVQELKDAIIERSGGDSRAQFCIMDTFSELEVGKAILEKYPQMRVAELIEGHARHSGQHAAGVLVTAEPVRHFCSVDERSGVAMIDKKDAEKLDLLKIDALGLRTLTILQETLEAIKWPMEKLLRYRTDDKKAFAILNEQRFSGIFQFEGYALQNICKQVVVESFEDMTALSALARPGPLISGGTEAWIKRRTGKEPVSFLHPMAEDVTRVTFGIVVYQEQVMQIARLIGKMGWEEISSLRKAMAGSLGKEYFDQYWRNFLIGAEKNGLSEPEALRIWENINTMGSWAFNRSHAVSYGMVSYWTCVLKARYPLQFAAATLRNAKDEDQVIRVLRELDAAGYGYTAFDQKLSGANWEVKKKKLIGGFLNIKGVGEKKAARLIAKRIEKIPYTPAEERLMDAGTPYDALYETELLWGHRKRNPGDYKIYTRILDANQITEDTKGEFVFIGKLKQKILRDHNEPILVQRRDGRVMEGQVKFLNLTFEDDTETLPAQINRWQYLRIGTGIIEHGRIGDWFQFKGEISRGFRRAVIKQIIHLDPERHGHVD